MYKLGKWLLIGLLATAGAGQAQEFRLESAGVRGGVSGRDTSREFHQAEGFVNWNLPWAWDLGAKCHLQSRLNLSAGWLGDGTDAGILTLGPSLVLGREHFPLSVEGGVSPTFLTQAEFLSLDIGSMVEFTSYLGLNCDVGWRMRLGYRFQHMSNAGIGSNNPGLNMHLFGLSYLF